jgi:hypothetical protein
MLVEIQMQSMLAEALEIQRPDFGSLEREVLIFARRLCGRPLEKVMLLRTLKGG